MNWYINYKIKPDIFFSKKKGREGGIHFNSLKERFQELSTWVPLYGWLSLTWIIVKHFCPLRTIKKYPLIGRTTGSFYGFKIYFYEVFIFHVFTEAVINDVSMFFPFPPPLSEIVSISFETTPPVSKYQQFPQITQRVFVKKCAFLDFRNI